MRPARSLKGEISTFLKTRARHRREDTGRGMRPAAQGRDPARRRQLMSPVAALFRCGAPAGGVCLSGPKGPLAAFLAYWAAAANGHCLFCVDPADPGGADRKEDLRVVGTAATPLDPILALVVQAVHGRLRSMVRGPPMSVTAGSKCLVAMWPIGPQSLRPSVVLHEVVLRKVCCKRGASSRTFVSVRSHGPGVGRRGVQACGASVLSGPRCRQRNFPCTAASQDAGTQGVTCV